jgi:uncharacterized membrane protein (DUF106 family)
MAIEKEQRPAMPKGQFLQIFFFMAAIFVLFDNNLRLLLGRSVGVVLNPLIGFNSHLPALTILASAILMVGLSTFIRHLFIDWIQMARTQNIMRSFQKAMREARVSRDQRRMEQLQKAQTKLMGLQAEMSGGQMKPMGFTFLIIIPMFAWLSQFIQGIPYPYFAAPWNGTINMFESTVLPHWLLFYTAISIPFGILVQKGFKFFTWRDRWHLMNRPPAVPEAPESKA